MNSIFMRMVALVHPRSLVYFLVVSGVSGLPASTVQADGLLESQKIFASDGKGIDLYGTSVAVDGDTLVVGASRDDSADPDAGSVYVYTRLASGAWGNELEFSGSDTELGDWFGWSVGLSDNVLVVGALLADGAQPLPIDKGAVYVFERDSSGWSETAILTPSDIDPNTHFGDVVATDGITVAVGVYKDNVNGANSGSVYLYERNSNGSWVQIDKLTRENGQLNEHFGDDIALDAGRLIVSTHRERTVGTDSGAAYVYTRDAVTGWQLEDKLVASDITAGDRFGYSVDIRADVAAIGAPGNLQLGIASGAAYVFKRSSDGSWIEQQKVFGLDTQDNDQFGLEVGISEQRLAVGTEMNDERGFRSGAAYLFYEQPSGDWLQQAKLLASDARARDALAHSLDMDSQTIVLGAWNAVVASSQGAAFAFSTRLVDNCGGAFNLPFDQWRMISLPCEPPAGQATVEKLFGDDIGGVYRTDWIVFGYDPQVLPDGDYYPVDETTELEAGKGYWIINATSGETQVSLDMPTGSTKALVDRYAGDSACTSVSGCVELSLTTRGPQPTFDLHGYPFDRNASLSNWRVVSEAQTSPTDCSTQQGCGLIEGSDALLFFQRVFAYNGESYDTLEEGSSIMPWSGFWAVALDRAEADGASLIIGQDAPLSVSVSVAAEQ